MIVTANDGKVETAKSFSMTVNNVPPTPKINGAPTTSPEGTEIHLIGSATDPSTADTKNRFRSSWSVTKNGVPSGSGDTGLFSFTPDDDAPYIVTLKATDKDGGEGTTTASIEVTNVAPAIIGTIAVPSDPVRVGSAVPFSVSFVDPGKADTHTAVWRWNNGGASTGSVTESDGSGSVTDSLIFTAPGIYKVSLTVADKDGDSGTSTATNSIVVYDPSGGFVTGGGWLTSPTGAYTAKPELAGKANFGFVSR